MVLCTAQEVLFEWSHHGILSIDLKVRSALHVTIIGLGVKRSVVLFFSMFSLHIG